MKKPKPEMIEAMAQWWADQFLVEEKREGFKNAFVRRFPLYIDKRLVISTDYEPDEFLCDVIEDCGIKITMRNARGFLPAKTVMTVEQYHYVMVSGGYGAQFVPVPWMNPMVVGLEFPDHPNVKKHGDDPFGLDGMVVRS